mmetsp:Transcript_42582/g.103000  ORF Transcript_42582/g.103000 Transcript_42582/m.103000 type:complete len:251 (-) Transcript_42582:2427-3179(-)
MASIGCRPTALHSFIKESNEFTFLLDGIDTGEVAVQEPHCCPNCAVFIWSGPRTEPLNSNLALESSKLVNGLSCKSPRRPSAANGSIGSMAAEADVGLSASAGAGRPRSSSSTLAVSTMGGAAAGAAGSAAGAAIGVGANMALPKISSTAAAAGAGVGATSKAIMSNKSISAAGAGGGAGAAATGGAATGGAAAGTGRDGTGAGAGAGGGTDPGTIPPKSAAACRSFSNCSGVFWVTGAGAGAPYPLLPP